MKMFVVTILSILMLSGGIFLFFSLQKPIPLSFQQRQKAFERLTGSTYSVSSVPQKTGWIRYTGHFISFTYPAAAEEYPSVTGGEANVQENFQFQGVTPKYFFVVEVFNQSQTMTFDDIPAVKLRRIQNDIYTESTVQVGGIHVVTFTKSQDGFEKSAFFIADEHVYSLVITTSEPQLERLFDQVLQSVKIK